MRETRLIRRSRLSPYANLAEKNYRDSIQPREEQWDRPEKWLASVRGGDQPGSLAYLLRQGVRLRGKILECGGAVCWLPALVSQLPEVGLRTGFLGGANRAYRPLHH